MKTYTLDCYQPFGTQCPHAYTVDIHYRGRRLARFTGTDAGTKALQWIESKQGRARLTSRTETND